MFVCVCLLCVLWGSTQSSVESKTSVTNIVVWWDAPQLGVVVHLGAGKKITGCICILSYYYCNYIANLKALGADSLVLRTRSGV